MADSLPPMTNETLAAIGRRVDARDGSDHYTFTIDGIGYDGHWAHDTHRLIAEVQRLNRELHGRRNLGVEYERLRVENIELTRHAAYAAAVISGDAAEMLAESLAKSRSECAALAAKLDETKTESARLYRRLQEVAGRVEAERDALAAKVEAARSSLVATTVGARQHWEFIRAMEGKKDHYTPEATAFAEGSEKGSLSMLQAFLEATGEAHPDDETTAAEEVVETALEAGSGMPHAPAQEGAGDAETSETGSGRGTGVSDAPRTAQEDDTWFADVAEAARPVHYREAAQSLRNYAHRGLHPERFRAFRDAADLLDSTARDLDDDSPSLPVEEGP